MPSSSSPARPAPFGYAGKGQRFDECVDAAGNLRRGWAQFFDLLGPDPAKALAAADAACHRAIVEQDVSMNVYRGERSGAQVWPLDAMPMLIEPADWAFLTRGLRQRAHLFNELLVDLYGEQRAWRECRLPAALAMANPHFLRACAGLGAKQEVFLHSYAVDLARSPDGKWWVIDDRLDAPSGLGYSLQNRIITRQGLPEVFHRAPVHRLFQFFKDYRASLESLAPHRESDPRVVLLSPGPANETYHEQAYLARYLGYTLVEGEDLTTRDGRVYLRTVGGLKRADVILRRLDSDFCDPLELDARSLLGVPGLLQAAHSGGVGLANLPGARALETPGLMAFIGPLCRQVLGEDLLLPNVATWWCGQAAARDYVLANLPHLVIKPTFRTRDSAPSRYGAWMGRAGRAALAERIRAEPGAWCAQERVFHGTTPGWHEGQLRPMPFLLRLFVTWHDGDYVVLPGGLTRCNPRGEDMIVSLQRGSVSKDTWVLHAGAPTPLPAFITSRPADSLRNPAATPSRRANDLFWLGRYLERCSQLARKFEKIDAMLSDDIAHLDPSVPADALRLLAWAQDLSVPAELALGAQAARLKEAGADPAHLGGLAANLANLVRLLEQLKVHLPHEGWQLLRQLRQRRGATDAAACAWLRQQLSVIESLSHEAMPRDTAWRFLDLGRRVERGQQVLQLVRMLLFPAAGVPATEFRLQSALHLADSLFTYRSAYHGQLDNSGALDWLLLSEANPRSFRFQAERIHEHLRELPADFAPQAVDALRGLAFRLQSAVRLAEANGLAAEPARSAGVVAELQAQLFGLSEQLAEIYFAHTKLR
jgi:uncharacterized circularly permuted ATP-grasp superfamily protein/uncharacterized alpha-E superfamily protein